MTVAMALLWNPSFLRSDRLPQRQNQPAHSAKPCLYQCVGAPYPDLVKDYGHDC
ncbi:MAG TPA: hypothetical protein V6D20_05185 [Candidatus Obscuribacterales bacterium]